MVSGNLITRNYTRFAGVDFSNRKDEVSLYHSPDALNVWKNYRGNNGKCIETRPDLELLQEFSNTIYGHFFYTYNNEEHEIFHVGDRLYDNGKLINLTENTGNMSSTTDNYMAERKSNFFVYGKNLFILDGTNYIAYNGGDAEPVKGYIPTTSISRTPTGGGVVHEDVNLLTSQRKNAFCSDGITKEYKLDVPFFDENSTVKVWIDDKLCFNNENIRYSTNNSKISISNIQAYSNATTAGKGVGHEEFVYIDNVRVYN